MSLFVLRWTVSLLAVFTAAGWIAVAFWVSLFGSWSRTGGTVGTSRWGMASGTVMLLAMIVGAVKPQWRGYLLGVTVGAVLGLSAMVWFDRAHAPFLVPVVLAWTAYCAVALPSYWPAATLLLPVAVLAVRIGTDPLPRGGVPYPVLIEVAGRLRRIAVDADELTWCLAEEVDAHNDGKIRLLDVAGQAYRPVDARVVHTPPGLVRRFFTNQMGTELRYSIEFAVRPVGRQQVV
jgi:hypothetical protein